MTGTTKNYKITLISLRMGCWTALLLWIILCISNCYRDYNGNMMLLTATSSETCVRLLTGYLVVRALDRLFLLLTIVTSPERACECEYAPD